MITKSEMPKNGEVDQEADWCRENECNRGGKVNREHVPAWRSEGPLKKLCHKTSKQQGRLPKKRINDGERKAQSTDQ